MLLTDLHFIDIDPLREPAFAYTKHKVISGHLPLLHPAVFCKRPIFQAITSLPRHTVISIPILIPELYGDLVVCEGEELLAQAIFCLSLPLLCQEGDDLVMAFDE
jgi:hypothetical protein